MAISLYIVSPLQSDAYLNSEFVHTWQALSNMYITYEALSSSSKREKVGVEIDVVKMYPNY